MRLPHALPFVLPLLLAALTPLAQKTLALAPPPAVTSGFVDGPVGLTPAQTERFKSALDALARQGHVCIVAEGIPLHPTLTPGNAPAVPDHTPLSAAVALVADSYDYDTFRTGNVFTLTKRYSDPADLPDVTIEECTEDAHNAALALDTFNPPQPTSGQAGLEAPFDQFEAILDGLSPEQRRAVFSKQGLPVSEIGDEARTALDQWNLEIFLEGPANDAHGCEIIIGRADKASVGVSTLDMMNRDGSPDTSHVYRQFGRREIGRDGSSAFGSFLVAPLKEGYDPSGGPVTPEERAAAQARLAERQADGHETLAQAVSALDVGGAHYEINSALAAKTVTVAGEVNVKPAAVLAGLAQVYGLRVRLRQSDGVTVLDLPERVTPADVTAIQATVQALLPAPLVRASHLADQGTSQAGMDEDRRRMEEMGKQGRQGSADFKTLSADFQRLRKRMFADRDLLPATELAAVRTLRVASELYPPSAKVDGLLPVAAMTAADRALYADAIMLPFLNKMNQMFRPQSLETVTQEDQLVLTASVYPDTSGHLGAGKRWGFNMFLCKPTLHGELAGQVGVAAAYFGTPPDDEINPAVAATPAADAQPGP